MYLQFGLNRNLLWFFLMASLLLLICPVVSSASELNQNSNEKLENKVKYELSIKNNLITLNAKDAALKKILEDIGQRMNIEVFARIPAEDKITTQFANLTLEEALKKFKKNYALVTDSKDKDGNILSSADFINQRIDSSSDAGVQELKEWMGFLNFLNDKFPAGGSGISEAIYGESGTAMGRANIITP
jgi:hypothetical protein